MVPRWSFPRSGKNRFKCPKCLGDVVRQFPWRDDIALLGPLNYSAADLDADWATLDKILARS
jgi:hypothetical protein